MYWYNRNWDNSFIERCSLFGVSSIRGSTVVANIHLKFVQENTFEYGEYIA